jgi:hypothetical protein
VPSGMPMRFPIELCAPERGLHLEDRTKTPWYALMANHHGELEYTRRNLLVETHKQIICQHKIKHVLHTLIQKHIEIIKHKLT